MKQIFIAIGLIILLVVSASAGKVVDLPSAIQFEAPTGEKGELVSVNLYWMTSGYNWAEVVYYPLDTNNQRRELQRAYLRDVPDNPDTVPADCTAEDEPYGCCTGAYPADQNTACVETQTDFTDFVQGYGTTMETRAMAAAWADIQTKYSLAP
jgi:hypothetical protein